MKLTPQQAQETFQERLALALAARDEAAARWKSACYAYDRSGNPVPLRTANDELNAAYEAVRAVYRSLLYGVPE